MITFYCIHDFDGGKQLYKIEYNGDLIGECVDAHNDDRLAEFLDEKFEIPYNADDGDSFDVLTENDFFHIVCE